MLFYEKEHTEDQHLHFQNCIFRFLTHGTTPDQFCISYITHMKIIIRLMLNLKQKSCLPLAPASFSLFGSTLSKLMPTYASLLRRNSSFSRRLKARSNSFKLFCRFVNRNVCNCKGKNLQWPQLWNFIYSHYMQCSLNLKSHCYNF